MGSRIRLRRGYALAEVTMVLALTVIIGVTLCSALLMQSRLARSVGERIAHNDAARAVMHILPSELRSSDPRFDVRAATGDSIAARWFRGSGVVCDTSGSDTWIRMRTMRDPDPDKDSLLVITDAGENAIPFTSVTAGQGRCPTVAGEDVYRVRAAGVTNAATVMFFESGSYYLSQRALRYRIGGEGRQPLTEEFLRDAGSLFALTVDTLHASRFRMLIEIKPGLQYGTGRVRQVTVFLPNSER